MMARSAPAHGDALEIGCFDDLLRVARAQPEPQRLLFVFAGAALSDTASPAQRAQFEAGEGGELAPLMCVDKAAEALDDFEALVSEAAQAGPPWAILFTAALSGRGSLPPTSQQTDAALQHMVDAIKSGRLEGMLPFDRSGEAVRLR
jgi:hypothetical protein